MFCDVITYCVYILETENHILAYCITWCAHERSLWEFENLCDPMPQARIYILKYFSVLTNTRGCLCQVYVSTKQPNSILLDNKGNQTLPVIMPVFNLTYSKTISQPISARVICSFFLKVI